MSNGSTHKGWRLMMGFYVSNSIATFMFTFAAGLLSTAEINVGAWERTIPGLIIALLLGLYGEHLSRNANEGSKWGNEWFATNLLVAGYGLAYFFVMAMYYVPVLKASSLPYYTWGGFLALATLATWHGRHNKWVRWFFPYSLLLTVHALYGAMSSKIPAHIFGIETTVAAIGCFVGMIYCGFMSVMHKRERLKYPKLDECKTLQDFSGALIYGISHELFFVAAAGCAMYLPLIHGTLADAPTYWALEAIPFLLISWRNGNGIKHAGIAAMWLFAAFEFVNAPFANGIPFVTIASVVGVGALIASAYRFDSMLPEKLRLPTTMDQSRKFLGYAVYLYGAIACALVVPVKVLGIWDAMPYLMAAALVISLLGIALRDGIVHNIGVGTACVALFLFFGHYTTWTLGLVVPVVALCYGLSLWYTYIHKKGGYERDKFLPFGPKYAVSAQWAELLEQVWSWVGFATLVVASFVLVDKDHSVLYWAAEGAAIMWIGFRTDRTTYRLQSWVVLSLGLAKFFAWDVSGSHIGIDTASFSLVWTPGTDGMIWYRAAEAFVLAAAFLHVSLMYRRKIRAIKAAEAEAQQALEDEANKAKGLNLKKPGESGDAPKGDQGDDNEPRA